MLWHFDELSEFARSGHGGFDATGATEAARHLCPHRPKSGRKLRRAGSVEKGQNRTHAAQQTSHSLFDHLVGDQQ